MPQNRPRTSARPARNSPTRLAREEAKHTGELAAWIAAERLYLDVLLNRNLDKAAEGCWKTLDAKLPKIDENSDAAAVLHAELDFALRNRYLMTLLNLTARKIAAPALVRRMLDYLDANIARELAEQSENQQWKLLKYELLVALDPPEELEKTLKEWIKAGDADNRWRVALGYLLAEQGKLAEAIGLFEAVAADDELGPGEYRTLADWYMAVNRRADYEKARVENFKVMDEWQTGPVDQRSNAALGKQPRAVAVAVGSRGDFGLPRNSGQIGQPAELPGRPSPRVVPRLPRFPVAFLPCRQHSRPHGRADLSVPASGRAR